MNKNSFLKKLRPISIGASMADMAMLLLVFFMATTTFEPPRGVEVDLPTSITRSAEQDSVYVTIAKTGQIYLGGKPVSLKEMNEVLAMRSGEKEHIVAITADRNLSYSQVKKVLDVLKAQDFLNVVFMSEPKKEQ